MSVYGVKPSGFVRKPLKDILRTIELEMVQVFGEGVIQTSESPLGQINGIMADEINRIWEEFEQVYQSFDPDQAEGTRLTSIAKLRLLPREAFTDIELRKLINNEGINKFNLNDIKQSLMVVPGITYLEAFLNDDGDLNGIGPSGGMALGDVCFAIIGGDDSAIADQLVKTMPIGSNSFGDTTINSTPASSVSQSFKILRVQETRVELSLQLRLKDDKYELYQPDIQQVIEGFVQSWAEQRINGRDVDSFSIRRLIECRYPNIELVQFTATVDGGSAQAAGAPVAIDFENIAGIIADDVTAVFV